MKIGLIGLPNSGKTTIFNALTKRNAEVTSYVSMKTEPNIAMVDVFDERVARLSNMYNPKKTVFATLELIDFVGVKREASDGSVFSQDMLQLIKNLDALALVVRNFQDDLLGDAAPVNDVMQIVEDLLLADLMMVENRLLRIDEAKKRGKAQNILPAEEKALEKIKTQLDKMRPLRELSFTTDEEKSIRGFQFLTLKPFMIVLNSAEDDFGKSHDVLESLSEHGQVIEFAGNFEMELSELSDDEEAKLFMSDLGITESAKDRLTKCAYEVLGYVSFFTVGADEVRAWNVQRGSTALEAAGTIHTDLMRGFIRAEKFSYSDLITSGSEKAVRDIGKFRLEGKEYVVNDGDVLSIRFNV